MSRKITISLTGNTYNYDDYTTKLLEEKDIHLLFAQRYQWIDTKYRIDKHVVLYNDNYYKLNDLIPKNSDNLESIYDLEDDDLIINLNERGLKFNSIQSLAQHSKNHTNNCTPNFIIDKGEYYLYYILSNHNSNNNYHYNKGEYYSYHILNNHYHLNDKYCHKDNYSIYAACREVYGGDGYYVDANVYHNKDIYYKLLELIPYHEYGLSFNEIIRHLNFSKVNLDDDNYDFTDLGKELTVDIVDCAPDAYLRLDEDIKNIREHLTLIISHMDDKNNTIKDKLKDCDKISDINITLKNYIELQYYWEQLLIKML